ncbi:hypothetical protein EHS19_06735 [Bifidobacterium jacchi]|uniref:Uncharacterized protein n=1 Tax=Bifidobacterium jacchi TaxID=2490545 RepID=A0A5N5RHF6_9BIFI|nr:hypothetical protein EHS19_06735 [Bifidobacterium jacchi]
MSKSRADGWRRVSDGDPCAFCAMLVTRGPVYTSRDKALHTTNPAPGIPSGTLHKYHPPLRMHRRDRLRRLAAHRTGTAMDRRLLSRRRKPARQNAAHRQNRTAHPAQKRKLPRLRDAQRHTRSIGRAA